MFWDCFFLIFKQRKQKNTHFICNAEIEPGPGLPQLQTELSPVSPLITAKQVLEKSQLFGKGSY